MATAISTFRTWLQAMAPGAGTSDCDEAVLEAVQEFCDESRALEVELPTIQVLAYIDSYALAYSGYDIVAVEWARYGTRDLLPYAEYLARRQIANDRRDRNAEYPQTFLVKPNDDKITLIHRPNEDSEAYKSCTDLTFVAATSTADAYLTSATVDFDDEGFEAGDKMVVKGSDYNDQVYTIDAIGDSGAGSNNKITVNEDFVAEGTADASAILSVDGLHVSVCVKPDNDATTIDDHLALEHRKAIRHGALANLLMRPAAKWRNWKMGSAYAASFEQLKGKAFMQKRYGKTRATPTGIRA